MVGKTDKDVDVEGGWGGGGSDRKGREGETGNRRCEMGMSAKRHVKCQM